MLLGTFSLTVVHCGVLCYVCHPLLLTLSVLMNSAWCAAMSSLVTALQRDTAQYNTTIARHSTSMTKK